MREQRGFCVGKRKGDVAALGFAPPASLDAALRAEEAERKRDLAAADMAEEMVRVVWWLAS